jgi:bisphosphoglycerate-dependent phosphoglycerate mutase
MVRLLLVRHAETTWNAQQRFQGHTDVPLSPGGQRQVVALVQALRAETIHACYTSDLCRARETARSLTHPRGLPLRQEPRLREMAFGAWEGLRPADVQQHDPHLLAAWYQDPLHVAPPGGETLRQVAHRVQASSWRTRITRCCSSAMGGHYACSSVSPSGCRREHTGSSVSHQQPGQTCRCMLRERSWSALT